MDIKVEFDDQKNAYWVRLEPVEFPAYYAVLGYAYFRSPLFSVDGSLVYAHTSQAVWELLSLLSDLGSAAPSPGSTVSLTSPGSITWTGINSEVALVSGTPIPLSAFTPHIEV